MMDTTIANSMTPHTSDSPHLLPSSSTPSPSSSTPSSTASVEQHVTPIHSTTFFKPTPENLTKVNASYSSNQKARINFTAAQLRAMEDVFKKEPVPSSETRQTLSQQIDVPPRRIQVWFQNRRARSKNKSSSRKKKPRRVKEEEEDTDSHYEEEEDELPLLDDDDEEVDADGNGADENDENSEDFD